jgi:toxin-antitoxin system PIN domain toxin
VTVLLDANVLIALVVADHVHHDAAETWFVAAEDTFATCPVTQGSLIRLLVRQGQPAETAVTLIAGLTGHPRHEFWPDDESFEAVPLRGVIGHRQVTDVYLAHLATARRGRLATFDQGLAKLREEVTDLVPTLS